MNSAKILVLVMSGLLLAGVGVLVVGLSLGWHLDGEDMGPEPSAIESIGFIDLEQPEGSIIHDIAISNGQVAVTVSGGGVPQRVILVDAQSGIVNGKILLNVPSGVSE
ncbi:MAG: hypothetical protein OSB02_11680 [Rhodospirillaceae bacterium]|nr:hypothetical protein [Rhodospirillaceae bacterium]